MPFKKLLSIAIACSLHASAQKRPVTVDAAAAYAAPRFEAVWAPDGRTFVYQQGGTLGLFDAAAGSRTELVALSTLSSAATPMAEPPAFEWQNRGVQEKHVQWFPSGDALLVSAGGALFRFRLSDKGWTRLTATPERESDPKLSPDGRRVSFRRGNDLYSMDVASGRVTRLTRDGSEARRNARLDWVYPEELGLETAHWWSPDSARIAYLQFDVGAQPLYPHASLLPLAPGYEPQRYPKAGQPNATVRVGVVAARGGRTRWMAAGATSDTLLARVDWTPDGRALFVQRLNRVQNRLELLRADASNGASPRAHRRGPLLGQPWPGPILH
jgi:dipeptidyl-peptidase-4